MENAIISEVADSVKIENVTKWFLRDVQQLLNQMWRTMVTLTHLQKLLISPQGKNLCHILTLWS